jgi:hypothetical protein
MVVLMDIRKKALEHANGPVEPYKTGTAYKDYEKSKNTEGHQNYVKKLQTLMNNLCK